MQYRTLPHGGEKIGVIGLGLGTIHEQPPDVVEAVFRYALEHGINLFDLCAGHIDVFRIFGKVIAGRRKNVLTQMHFGAVYGEDDKYANTQGLDEIKRSFDRVLSETGTDYTDMGFFHCVDEDSHFDHIMKNGVFDYVLSMKAAGAVRHVGFSSHNPSVACRFLETGVIDLCMFSINPAYDYQKGDFAVGASGDRARFYRMCEREGVGISVMKPFCAGQLLDEKTSPIGIALRRNQCLQYALERPAVLSCVPGVRSVADVQELLTFFDASPEETSYTALGNVTPRDVEGNCIYCNHCQPCPAGIDIGLVNKYYDLAQVGDTLAKDHYQQLQIRADSCIQCGSCNAKCPFHVKQTDRMNEIRQYFSV